MPARSAARCAVGIGSAGVLLWITACVPVAPLEPRMAWIFVDGGAEWGINRDPGRNASYPQLLVFRGDLHATWYETAPGATQVRVARREADASGGGAWRFLDGGGERGLNRDPGQAALWSRLAVLDDRLYCYWFERLADETTTIRVARYNGDPAAPSWSYVDGSPESGLRWDTVAGEADYASLETLGGRLYAAWRETDGSRAYQIRVAAFNGDSASPLWTFVDGRAEGGINVDRAREAYYPKLTAFDGKLYILWYELNGSWRTMRCAVYNGNDTSPDWTVVGGAEPEGLNFDPHKDANAPQLLVADGALYATWYERGGDLISHPRFARYSGDDASPAWVFVDGGMAAGFARDPDQDAWWPRAAALDTQVVVAWTERAEGVYRVRVSIYDTVRNRWTAVEPPQGLNYDPIRSAEYPHLAIAGDDVYLAWSERHDGVLQARVMRGVVE